MADVEENEEFGGHEVVGKRYAVRRQLKTFKLAVLVRDKRGSVNRVFGRNSFKAAVQKQQKVKLKGCPEVECSCGCGEVMPVMRPRAIGQVTIVAWTSWANRLVND